MLTAARSSKAVAAAALLPESRRRKCSRRGNSAAAAAASIARSSEGRGRQRRAPLRRPLPPPLPTALLRVPPRVASAASSPAPGAPTLSAAAAAAAAAAETTIETELGPLKVRPLKASEVAAAAIVITRAFSSNGTSPPLADVETWLAASSGSSSTTSETAVLVAELIPEDKELLAPGRSYRVAGVAAVALSAAAAAAAVGGGGGGGSSGGSSSASPLPFPLLCNVAVDPRLRRLGIGRALVIAAEAVAKEAGELLFVIARGSEDAAAEKLYSSLGFAEVEGGKKKGDSFFSSLFRNKASAEKLMKKQL